MTVIFFDFFTKIRQLLQIYLNIYVYISVYIIPFDTKNSIMYIQIEACFS